MSSVPKKLSNTAVVDEAAVQPFPNSKKVYIQGSRSDIRVPVREISLMSPWYFCSSVFKQALKSVGIRVSLRRLNN